MYEDGYSEEIVGEALRGRREGVFLVDKIDHLDRPVSGQLDESLGRLELPAVDLLAFHAVPDAAAWRKLERRGGGMAELGEEIARGRARFRGISCHDPEVLDLALASSLCDVVMFPVGPFCDPRYVLEILPRARALGVGTICFKTFGAGKLVADSEGYGRPLTALRSRGEGGRPGRAGSSASPSRSASATRSPAIPTSRSSGYRSRTSRTPRSARRTRSRRCPPRRWPRPAVAPPTRSRARAPSGGILRGPRPAPSRAMSFGARSQLVATVTDIKKGGVMCQAKLETAPGKMASVICALRGDETASSAARGASHDRGTRTPPARAATRSVASNAARLPRCGHPPARPRARASLSGRLPPSHIGF